MQLRRFRLRLAADDVLDIRCGEQITGLGGVDHDRRLDEPLLAGLEVQHRHAGDAITVGVSPHHAVTQQAAYAIAALVRREHFFDDSCRHRRLVTKGAHVAHARD